MQKKPTNLWLRAGEWCLPLLVSAFVGYGSAQYARGTADARLTTMERDVKEAQGAHSNFVTRDEFKLILDDLKEIKQDVREVRRSLQK